MRRTQSSGKLWAHSDENGQLPERSDAGIQKGSKHCLVKAIRATLDDEYEDAQLSRISIPTGDH